MKVPSRRVCQWLLGLVILLCANVASAQLTFQIEMNPDPPQPGETIHVALTVGNRGAASLFGVTVQARVPQNVSSFSPILTTGGGQCPPSFCDPLELVTWTLGTLPARASRTVTMPLVVGTRVAAGTEIVVDASVQANGVSTVNRDASVVVEVAPLLELALDEEQNPIAPRAQLTYTLTFGNRSDVTVTNVVLRMPLPVGLTFLSATDGGVLSGNTVRWALRALPPGAQGHRQVTIRVGAGWMPGAQIRIDAAQIRGRAAGASVAAYAVAVTRVENTPPLALAVELNPDPVRPGEMLLAALTVSNRSGATLSGVQVQARVPQHVFSIRPDLITGGGQCPPSFCDANELVTWTLGTLPARASRTVTMPLVVGSASAAPPDGTVLTVWAEVRHAGIKSTTASASVGVHSDPLLELAVDDSRDPVAPGNAYAYRLTFGNRSTEDVTATRLRMPLPTGTTFVSASDGGVLNGRVVAWNLGRLRAGQSNSRQVVVRATTRNIPTPAGTLLRVNAAEMTGNTATGNIRARAVAVTRVEPSRPLRLNMVLSPNPVARGQAMIVTMTVSNMGTAPLSGVQLQARVPQHVFSFRPILTTGGGQCPPSFCDPTELVTWTLGTLPARASRTVTMPPVVGTSGVPDGTLIAVEAEVKNATVLQATRRATTRVSGP